MRLDKWSSAFKKDFKRESKGQNKNVMKEEFYGVINALANDRPLPWKYKDHDLTGEWSGYRECHFRPDFLIIYRKEGEGTLYLARLGRADASKFGAHEPPSKERSDILFEKFAPR
jgi:mRNA interferase YafQ